MPKPAIALSEGGGGKKEKQEKKKHLNALSTVFRLDWFKRPRTQFIFIKVALWHKQVFL